MNIFICKTDWCDVCYRLWCDFVPNFHHMGAAHELKPNNSLQRSSHCQSHSSHHQPGGDPHPG